MKSLTPKNQFKSLIFGRRAGFTLVELMVAITGGIFVSIAVFALARHGSRLYQREARVANATLASIVGFERVRADLARAGFMTTPNILRDPRVCGRPATEPGWPTELKRLAALRIDQSFAVSNPQLEANGIVPDRITLAGNFNSVEQFPIRTVVPLDGKFEVYLEVNTPVVDRVGVENIPNIFTANRAIRVVDKSGWQHYGIIVSATGDANPKIVVSSEPGFKLQGTGTTCGLKGFETGALANVVNLVRYEIRSLKDNSNYAPLYSAAATGPSYDKDRLELVRTELNFNGEEIAGTEELVAEYAVNLSFGITAVGELNGSDPTLQTFGAGDPNLLNWAGPPSLTAATTGPQFIRSVRVRMSVRSREADRVGPIDGGPSIAPGLYRFRIKDGSYARVRTVQADVALHNLMGATWQ